MRNLILTILFLGGGLVSAQDIFVKKVTVIGAVENIESVKISDESISATSINSPEFIGAAGQPVYQLEETDQAVDAKKWRFQVNAGVFKFETLNDAETVFAPRIEIVRSSGLISFKNGNVDIANSLTVDGTVNISDDFTVATSLIFTDVSNGTVNLGSTVTGTDRFNVFGPGTGVQQGIASFYDGSSNIKLRIRDEWTASSIPPRIESESTLGFAFNTTNDAPYIWYINGTGNEEMRLTSTQLEINGQIKVTGGVPGSGKILTSDATGLATWEAASAGGWIDNGTTVNLATITDSIGIGIASPASILHLKKAIGTLTIEGMNTGSASPIFSIEWLNTDVTTYTAAKIESFNAGGTDDGDLRFYTTQNGVNAEAMRIDEDGDVIIGGNIQSNFVGGLVETDNSQKPAQNVTTAIQFDEISEGSAIQGITFTPNTNQTTFTMPFTGSLDATANFHFERTSSGGIVNYWMWFEKDNAGDNVFVPIGYVRHKPLGSAEHDVSMINLGSIAVNSGDQIRVMQRTDGAIGDGVGLLHGAPGFASPAQVVGCALKLGLKK